MAKSTVKFITSAKAIESNKDIITECSAKQGFPTILTAQLGEDTIALPAVNLSAKIFGTHQREDGGIALKVSISGTVIDGEVVPYQEGNRNFKLGGWVTCYPEGIEAPPASMVLTSKETEAVLGFTKDKSLWFDLEGTDFLYLVLAIGKDKHYVKDALGNKVPTGETDDKGNQLFQLEEHDILTFPLGNWKAPLSGSGTSGGITEEGMSGARARVLALLAAKSPVTPVTSGEVSARSL